ncbi:16S rRNA (guanine(966)-N(2))-methyltransferase RsmD [Vibrio metschnikovii]|uniref:Ribosomal RNA small subunit methyltransferase D n=1 Tax=Vibrio metschnikovii TaxID=28172 RepID=A0A9X0R9T1_VIBME|nr:16S rRNA (guanine(966)-N(2))-methyltransferase RsmD [Vibrio metschnikovii]EEX38617.1 ribosomal RNA small subunit methyltransferase D [Vibrio metschnikovii CIP 69.14]EKO3566756.1 16S rRNA (guanine(966)-N(2))-methyltransferase RsmD [Vibrio metschnikovii]EKO3771113.1 16S rRNA (guanine(966)-N(2))-methyltransferase RsmD [Vibrio metschnikovii]MBC5852434.1 16S rRNA (guanine(966)-N(2))-methyltransferase RsmD [Vibrio metschnikovii]MDA3139854.1 16S rRNA (guanine(966)-N(2))-methyltransferase RsmD [Vib
MLKRRPQTLSQKRLPSGHVRIISGLWRGRKLPVHDAQGLRPTTDRVKETVFNWLAQDIAKAKCLDLFAGSGSLGFECASRQANLVTMLELNGAAYHQLKSNIARLQANNINAVHGDTLQYLKQSASAYDVVFIDPPFHQGLINHVVPLLESNGWLAEQAIIYIECEKELSLNELPDNWQLHREKTAGQVCYRLYLRQATSV